MAAARSGSKPPLLRSQLQAHIARLRQIQSTVAVSVAALQRQNCEIDLDIASVLQCGVTDRIHEQIEQVESCLHLIEPLSGRKRPTGRAH